jgi:outer membrane receptor protein involved in Fe transport
VWLRARASGIGRLGPCPHGQGYGRGPGFGIVGFFQLRMASKPLAWAAMTVRSRSGFCLLLALLPWVAVRAQTVPLGPVVVTATRSELSSEVSPFATTALSSEALRNTPALSLDSALRSVPAFSLFRRSDSLTANPTAQGVSLRGLGPSGASR